MKRINFFATKDDLLLILQGLEASKSIKYTRASRLSGAEPEVWKTGGDLPQLGKATGDQAVAGDQFLVIEENSVIRVETRRMLNGVEKFDVYQSENPDSVVLVPGGQWTDNAIISGSIATLSESSVSSSEERVFGR